MATKGIQRKKPTKASKVELSINPKNDVEITTEMGQTLNEAIDNLIEMVMMPSVSSEELPYQRSFNEPLPDRGNVTGILQTPQLVGSRNDMYTRQGDTITNMTGSMPLAPNLSNPEFPKSNLLDDPAIITNNSSPRLAETDINDLENSDLGFDYVNKSMKGFSDIAQPNVEVHNESVSTAGVSMMPVPLFNQPEGNGYSTRRSKKKKKKGLDDSIDKLFKEIKR